MQAEAGNGGWWLPVPPAAADLRGLRLLRRILCLQVGTVFGGVVVLVSDTVIVGAARTPVGSYLGALSSLSAPQLGSVVIREAMARAGVEAAEVDEVIMGNILSAGLGQAPARQAALGAGLPPSVAALTINKMCGSGLKAVMLASGMLALGEARVEVAGGMESMSNAPYLLKRARTGYRLGHGELLDEMIVDGLWDAYNDCHMGSCTETVAEEYGFSRQEQDEFAARSYARAVAAQEQGWFDQEIVAVQVPQRRGDPVTVSRDEEPRPTSLETLRKLRPAFEKNGTITAGNASTINDGAAALVLTTADYARERGLRPMARILGYATAGVEPRRFITAPGPAIRKLLDKLGIGPDDVDLYEINEAFSVIQAVWREVGIPDERVNVSGGAVALGHPIGASGARVLTTLIYALQRTGGRLGVASLCLGGGEAVALAVERWEMGGR